MTLIRRVTAEFVGTFWLVFGGIGSAVLASSIPEVGIGYAGVALAFGLTLLTMAYAIGHISGCHINPAVSLGLWAAGRFPARDLLPYIISQVSGATFAAGMVFAIASGNAGFTLDSGLGSNGYGAHSPQGYAMVSAILTEFILTFFFLLVILGATDSRAPVGFAPIPIGLSLTLAHLIGIPVTNLSVNPARSTGPALFVGGWALAQLWLFWAIPIAGAIAAGLFYKKTLSEFVPLVPKVNKEDINVSRRR